MVGRVLRGEHNSLLHPGPKNPTFYDVFDIETAEEGTLYTHYTMVVLGEVRADFKTHYII